MREAQTPLHPCGTSGDPNQLAKLIVGHEYERGVERFAEGAGDGHDGGKGMTWTRGPARRRTPRSHPDRQHAYVLDELVSSITVFAGLIKEERKFFSGVKPFQPTGVVTPARRDHRNAMRTELAELRALVGSRQGH